MGFHVDSIAFCVHVRRFGASWALLDAILGFYQVSLVVATFLTVSDVFSVVLESLATLCTSARVRRVRLASEPHWLAYARFSRLVSKFDISDTFARLLELFLLPCACMQMLNIPGQLSSPPVLSAHDLVLPVGEFGDSGLEGQY